MKKYWHLLTLFFVIFFALSIRLYKLGIDSPTIYADEAGGHYQALQTLLQSADVVHKVYYFLQNGLSTLTWVFGLTPLGVRLPAAIYGTLVVLALYFFCSSFTTKRTALVATLIAAISPWSFMISRIGHPHLLLMLIFILLSMIFYLRSGPSRKIFVSLIFLGLAAYEYPSMIIITPPVVLLMLAQNVRKKILLPALLLISIALGICVFVYNGFSATGRGLDLAIWRDTNVTAENNLYRGIAGESYLTKLFYNYPTSVIGVFTKNYLSFFSPDFLFLKGDSVLRHSTGMVGEFLPFLLPFMLYGAFVFFTKVDKKLKAIFLVWILISPVPAAITKDGATYLLRAITMMPFLTYFCAQGIISSFGLFKNLYLKTIYGLAILGIGLYSVGGFLFGYFHVYPTLSASSWESGFKELSDFQVTHPGKLLTIWDDKYPVWYFCFWQDLPSNVCNQNKIGKNEMISNSRVDLPTGDLLFSLPQTESDLNQMVKIYKPTYVALPGKYEIYFPGFKKSAALIQTIKYPDQKIVFSIYKIAY